jgi:hypothetical protein
MNFEELYNEIKEADNHGNIIVPREYFKKLLLMNMLILQNKPKIKQQEIFGYLKDDFFEMPSAWDGLEDNKKEKFLTTVQEISNLLEKF